MYIHTYTKHTICTIQTHIHTRFMKDTGQNNCDEISWHNTPGIIKYPACKAYSARKYEYLHDHMLVLSTSKSLSAIYLITFTYILYIPLTLPTTKQNLISGLYISCNTKSQSSEKIQQLPCIHDGNNCFLHQDEELRQT